MNSRTTKTKKQVVKILSDSQAPLLMTEVFEQVRKTLPQTAYSTVYRIMQTFREEKKVAVVDWRERGNRYEWISDHHHHHHLVCNTCGEVTDVDDSLLNFQETKIQKQTGFLVQDHSIEVFGLCSPCQERE